MVRILFVSPHDAIRGPMAEAFALRYRTEEMDCFSSGLVGSGFVRPQAVTVLQEVGLAPDWEHPRHLLAEHLMGVDYLVTISCEVDEARRTHFEGREIRWEVEDILNKGLDVGHYRVVRDEIDELTRDLIYGLREDDLDLRVKASGGRAQFVEAEAAEAAEE